MKPYTWNLTALKLGPDLYSPLLALQIAQCLRRIDHNLLKHEWTSYTQIKAWNWKLFEWNKNNQKQIQFKEVQVKNAGENWGLCTVDYTILHYSPFATHDLTRYY